MFLILACTRKIRVLARWVEWRGQWVPSLPNINICERSQKSLIASERAFGTSVPKTSRSPCDLATCTLDKRARSTADRFIARCSLSLLADTKAGSLGHDADTFGGYRRHDRLACPAASCLRLHVTHSLVVGTAVLRNGASVYLCLRRCVADRIACPGQSLTMVGSPSARRALLRRVYQSLVARRICVRWTSS